MAEDPSQNRDAATAAVEPEAGARVGRVLRMSVAIVGVLLGGLLLWVWLSSGGDETLPFQYGGFD